MLMPGAHVVHDYPTASHALGSIRRRGVDPVVQECLDGEKLQAVIIRREGSTSFRMAFRVRREHPPQRGAEAMLERLRTTAGDGADLTSALERLADAVDYQGLLQAEFYRTASGRLYVIDVNPRLWGSMAFAELLGLGVTERVVRDALGCDPLSVPQESTDRRYHHLAREFRWSRAQPGGFASVLATSSPRDVWDLPSLTDPLPELLRLARRFRPAGGTRSKGPRA
jgi:biotin carboxylase